MLFEIKYHTINVANYCQTLIYYHERIYKPHELLVLFISIHNSWNSRNKNLVDFMNWTQIRRVRGLAEYKLKLVVVTCPNYASINFPGDQKQTRRVTEHPTSRFKRHPCRYVILFPKICPPDRRCFDIPRHLYVASIEKH